MNIAIDTLEVRKELKDLRRELKKKLELLTPIADDTIRDNWGCSRGNTDGILCWDRVTVKNQQADNICHDLLDIRIFTIQK